MTTIRWLATVVACALVLAIGAGCGSTPARQHSAQSRHGVVPVARVTKDQMVRWLLDVAQSPRCAPTRRLMHPALGKVSPKACEAMHSRLRGMVAANGHAYGTAMVLDFRTREGAHRSAVMVLDLTLVYRLLFVLDTGSATVNSSLARGVDATANRAARSLALGDCDAFLGVASRQLGIGHGPREAVCTQLPKLGVVRGLMAHPSSRLERQGGNRVFAFYGLRLAPGSYYTIVMVRRTTAGGRPATPARYEFVTAALAGVPET